MFLQSRIAKIVLYSCENSLSWFSFWVTSCRTNWLYQCESVIYVFSKLKKYIGKNELNSCVISVFFAEENVYFFLLLRRKTAHNIVKIMFVIHVFVKPYSKKTMYSCENSLLWFICWVTSCRKTDYNIVKMRFVFNKLKEQLMWKPCLWFMFFLQSRIAKIVLHSLEKHSKIVSYSKIQKYI